MSEPTLTQALRAAGYAHRPSDAHQHREIYRLATGRVVGSMRVQEAWAWLKSVECRADCEREGGCSRCTCQTPELGAACMCRNCEVMSK